MAKPRAKHLQSKNEAQRAMEVNRKRKIVTDQFFPALTAATVSVDEAKMLLGAITSLILEEVLRTMQERKFSDISDTLLKKLSTDGREEELKNLLSVFSKENLFVTKEIVEGMTNAINQMIQEDMQSRTLNSFKPDWERYLTK